MVNSTEFTKRLQIILEYYDLSAAAFADAINVGRSSISHILSGRNKPSLDFVLKIVQTFTEVELYWLLNGKGNFPATASQDKPTPLLTNIVPPSLPEPDKAPARATNEKMPSGKPIKKIVIFYQDGSFDAFEN